jgi:hypothetical protein
MGSGPADNDEERRSATRRQIAKARPQIRMELTADKFAAKSRRDEEFLHEAARKRTSRGVEVIVMEPGAIYRRRLGKLA